MARGFYRQDGRIKGINRNAPIGRGEGKVWPGYESEWMVMEPPYGPEYGRERVRIKADTNIADGELVQLATAGTIEQMNTHGQRGANDSGKTDWTEKALPIVEPWDGTSIGTSTRSGRGTATIEAGTVGIAGTVAANDTVVGDVSDPDGVNNVEYQWQLRQNGTGAWANASGTGHSAKTYTIGSGDIGDHIRLRVRYQQDDGTRAEVITDHVDLTSAEHDADSWDDDTLIVTTTAGDAAANPSELYGIMLYNTAKDTSNPAQDEAQTTIHGFSFHKQPIVLVMGPAVVHLPGLKFPEDATADTVQEARRWLLNRNIQTTTRLIGYTHTGATIRDRSSVS